MLVLSRKQGETILVGDEIEVTVLATTGNRVRLGIVAPRHVSIVRKELTQRDASPTVDSRRVAMTDEVCEIELDAYVA
jgi:carbon storage regulator